MDVRDVIGSDEKVVLLTHRHWISIVPLAFVAAVISMLSILGIYYVSLHLDRFNQTDSLLTVAVGLIGLLLLGLLFGYISIRLYVENQLIITDENLYVVTQNALLTSKVSQFALESLQDVAVAQNGFLPNILNFGDVVIETAGREENFVFHPAYRPRKLAIVIMDNHELAVRRTRHRPL